LGSSSNSWIAIVQKAESAVFDRLDTALQSDSSDPATAGLDLGARAKCSQRLMSFNLVKGRMA
jgi:hypothetical protein